MIRIQQYGPVTAFRLSRSLFGRPLYWTTAYWVDGLLIDAGPACTAQELLCALENRHVEKIVVTHAHEDHFGGLAGLHSQYPNARIFAHRGALETIAEPTRLNMELHRRLLWGTPLAKSGVQSLDDVANVVSTSAYSFRIVDTPGHSTAHISLFEPEQRWLFCGDAFIGGHERTWMKSSDLFGVVSSLRTMHSLQPQILFPGSGTVRTQPVQDIAEKLNWYAKLAARVALCESRGMGERAMVNRVLGGETLMRYLTGGSLSARNLIAACRSYNTLLSENCGTIDGDDTKTYSKIAVKRKTADGD